MMAAARGRSHASGSVPRLSTHVEGLAQLVAAFAQPEGLAGNRLAGAASRSRCAAERFGRIGDERATAPP
jgi:hypothetical protein